MLRPRAWQLSKNSLQAQLIRQARGQSIAQRLRLGVCYNGNEGGVSQYLTLLIALRGTDGLVLGADSRGTFGDPRGVTAQNDAQQKAHILSPHVAVLAAGSGEVAALIIDIVRQKIAEQKTDWATPVLDMLRDTVREQYNKWFPSVPPMQPIALIQSGPFTSQL